MIEHGAESMRISLTRQIDDSYDIVFGKFLFPKVASDLKKSPLGEKYAIITDSNVGPLYAGNLEHRLRDQGLKADIFSFQAGEPNKNLKTFGEITDQMGAVKYGRDSAIIALGGGVVGDMAGLIASNYCRNIPYVQIPTTTLSQADASVGGKTAIDTPNGKNLIGQFYQPKAVYIDTATLSTLPQREYISGLAEIVKSAVIRNEEFFEYLSDNSDLITRKNPFCMLDMAINSCHIKGKVVEIDPNEKGLRRILNYGHTAGHAIEKLSVDRYENGASDSYLLHGEAVAIGMMVAGRIANTLGYFSQMDLQKQERLLKAFKLSTTIPPEISNEAIIEVTSLDKKAKNGQARWVLPNKIGEMCEFNGVYADYVDNKIVEEALNQTR